MIDADGAARGGFGRKGATGIDRAATVARGPILGASVRPRKDQPVLVLSRKQGESVMIGDDVVVTVLEVRGDVVRIGVDAPRAIKVHREEVWRELQQSNQEAASPSDEAVAALSALLPPPAAPAPPAATQDAAPPAPDAAAPPAPDAAAAPAPDAAPPAPDAAAPAAAAPAAAAPAPDAAAPGPARPGPRPHPPHRG